jgi:hypothetical protein
MTETERQYIHEGLIKDYYFIESIVEEQYSSIDLKFENFPNL